ncbi:MAG: SH3 domain-containing protein [Anaerolineae bacterium]
MNLPAAGAAPAFLDSADGLLHLYYAGLIRSQNFFALHFNSYTSRAAYLLNSTASQADSSGLRFHAHRTGSPLNDMQIQLRGKAASDMFQLTISVPNGISETWDNLPGDPEKIAAVLNGEAAHTATDPRYINGETFLYDYENAVTRSGWDIGDAFIKPSLLLAAQPINAASDGRFTPFTTDVDGHLENRGLDPVWLPEPANQAARFVRGEGLLRVQDNLDLAPGHATIEAWIAPDQDPSKQAVLAYKQGDYVLAMGVNDGDVYAATRQTPGQPVTAVQTKQPQLQTGEWAHVAAVYKAGRALNLDGQSYVNCGNNMSLRGLSKAMTVEAWVTPAAIQGGDQMIAAKWGVNANQQSWALYLDKDGHPHFITRCQPEDNDSSDAQRQTDVRGDTALQIGKQYHLTAVFDYEPRKEAALNFTGSNYARVDYHSELRRMLHQEYTVEMWVRIFTQTDVAETSNRLYADYAAQGPFFIVYHNHTSSQHGHIGFGRFGDSHAATSDRAVNDGRWHHIALVKTVEHLILYIDGIESGRTQGDIASNKAEILNTNNHIWIGSDRDGTLAFSGQINDIRLWKEARSQEQILDNMDNRELSEGGLLLYYPIQPGSKGLDSIANTGGGRYDLKLEKGLSPEDVDKCAYTQRLYTFERDNNKMLLKEVGVTAEIEKENVMLCESDSDVTLGFVANHFHLQGQLDEVRIWQAPRRLGQIEYYKTRSLSQGAKGLVSEWRFEDPPGARTTLDSKSDNHGRLIHTDKAKIADMLVPTDLNAGWTIYVNGESVNISSTNLFDFADGFFIGGVRDLQSGTLASGLTGRLDELRLWQTRRTPEQIRDHRYHRLTGQEEELFGYWTFEGDEQGGVYAANTAFHDHSGNGRTAIIDEGQIYASLGAPVGIEGPEIQNALSADNYVPYDQRAMIIHRPAVAEYGDMQFDADGSLFGVMKRCYIFVAPEVGIQDIDTYQAQAGETLASIALQKNIDPRVLLEILQASSEPVSVDQPLAAGTSIPVFHEPAVRSIRLVSGFALGNLELQFISQVQTAPTLIGYIEGAPPVPSENLTVNPFDKETDVYVGNSSVELVESRDTLQVFTATREQGYLFSSDIKAGLAGGLSTSAGFGVFSEVFHMDMKAGIHSTLDISSGTLNEATLGNQTSQTLRSSLDLGGGWEQDENGRYRNPVVGRRYIPNNMGYALVKSGTADLFGLRLRQTGSLVAYHIMPNPDIPIDWNIIMFPLNPKYIKNGTLDGMVGSVADSDYADAATGERGSYFKPIEAYALKAKIRRQAKQIASIYDRFDAVQKSRAFHDDAKDNGLGDVVNRLGYDWNAGAARRSLVNTYVWTADGGFYAEEEQFSSIRQESLGGFSNSQSQFGMYLDTSIRAFGIGIFAEVDLLTGNFVNVTSVKSKEESAAFGLNIKVTGEGFLNKWEGDGEKRDGRYTADLCPGKVDGYRFMSFYLAPDNTNFETFFKGRQPVVDPDWLAGSSGSLHPNARALQAAMSRPNKVWRVLHRVTYVSRVPEEIGDPPKELAATQEEVPENVSGNWTLIREVSDQAKGLWDARQGLDLPVLGETLNNYFDSFLPAATVPWWKFVTGEQNGRPVQRIIQDDVRRYLKTYFTAYPPKPESSDDGTAAPTSGTQTTTTTATTGKPGAVSPPAYTTRLGDTLHLEVAAPSLPGSPNPIAYHWQKLNGPGVVTFTPNAEVLQPFVHFSKPGRYILELTAVVDNYRTTQQVTITVISNADYTATTRGNLNVRTGPGTQYDRINTIPAQMAVSLLGHNEAITWWYVQWGEMTGWVSGNWLQLPDPVPAAALPTLA